MAIYPKHFSSDPSLGPKVKTSPKKRGVNQMACKKKSTTTKKTSTKKSSCKKKPC